MIFSGLPDDLTSILPTSGEKVSPVDLLTPGQTKTTPKPPSVRLVDIFILGPAMVYSAMDRKPPKLLRAFMMAVGIGTILHNASAYIEQNKTKKT